MAAGALLFAGCYDPLTAEPANAVTWNVNNTRGYIETAKGEPDSTLGWGFVVEGGVARWNECTSASQCTGIERTRPARDVLAIDHVGRALAPDGEVEVVRLSLTPQRKYVVPPTNR